MCQWSDTNPFEDSPFESVRPPSRNPPRFASLIGLTDVWPWATAVHQATLPQAHHQVALGEWRSRRQIARMSSIHSTPVVTETGRRERHKAATRERIVRVAAELFIEHGFDAVTLEMVAAQCEVAVRTLLRYFPSKEAIALAPHRDALEAFRSAIVNRDCDVMDFWRNHIKTRAEGAAEFEELARRHSAMLGSTLALNTQRLIISEEYEDILADALIEEAGGHDSIGPRVLAAMLVAGNTAVLRYVLDGNRPVDPNLFVAVIDYATANFEGSFPTARPTARGRRLRWKR